MINVSGNTPLKQQLTWQSVLQASRHFFLSAGTLWQRELVRFCRQVSRIIGAFAAPLLFWFLIGSGLGTSFQQAGVAVGGQSHYLQYFFPGVLLLVVMFTSIFSSISLIEDRKEGFLQAVMVSPAPRSSIVFGKIAGGSTLALLQALLLLCFAPLAGIPVEFTTGFLVALVIICLAVAVTSMGFIFAWMTESVQGFHAIMNLIIMPMWFLSGALFPSSGASGWIRVLMQINPLSYGLDLLRRLLSPHAPPEYSAALSIAVTVLFAVTTYIIAWIILCRRQTMKQ